MEYYIERKDDHLAHHGIKGQKWGVRRYQNTDGSLTRAGKKRYNKDSVLTKEDMETVKNISSNFKYGKYEGRSTHVTKIGNDNNVEVTVISSSPNHKIKDSTEAVKFIKRFDIDKAKEGLAKEYYDKDINYPVKRDDIRNRDEFKKETKLMMLKIDPEYDSYSATYFAGNNFYGYVYFEDVGSMKNMKVNWRRIQD